MQLRSEVSGEVYDPAIRRPRKSAWFATAADAKAWRVTTENAIQHSGRGIGEGATLEEEATTWLSAVAAGKAMTRSGQLYKPSVARGYETSLRLHVFPVVGQLKVGTIRRADLQNLIDQIGLTRSASTVRNAITALRAFYRNAVARGFAASDPTDHLQLPAQRGRRDNIVPVAQAANLVEALAEPERGIFATAVYSGLRLGEIQALRICDVHLDRGYIEVGKSWDAKAGLIEPKSTAAKRRVPIVAALRPHLSRAIAVDRAPYEFVFGITPTTPFKTEGTRRRIYKSFDAAGLDRLGFHDARHTFASYMIAAGKLTPKQISVYMGHSSITTTYDIYGHLFPGNETDSAEKIDAYMAGVVA